MEDPLKTISASETVPFLECREVAWNSRLGRVLPPVSLKVGAELVVVRGGGTGKRLFMGILSGWQRPGTGEVLFRGRRLRAAPPETEISTYLNGMGLPDYWKAKEAWALWPSALPYEPISELIRALGISPETRILNMNRTQRNFCAMIAMLCRPAALYLFDDPFEGMEESCCIALLNELRGRVARGAGVVVSASLFPFPLLPGERFFDLA